MNDNKDKLLIVGAGGHTRVVIDTAEKNKYEIIGIIDINFTGKKEKIFGYDVLGNFDFIKKYEIENINCFIAIGDNSKRKKYYNMVKDLGCKIPNLIHPTAVISDYIDLSEGVFINAGCIINAGAIIGKNVIINTGSIIDHEVKIGDFSHIAPGCKIGGRVKFGAMTFVGIGTDIIDQIDIGENVIIGAGSVVVNSIAPNITVVGIPAKRIKS